MRIEKEIPIGQITMDRHPLNPSTLSLIDYLRDGGEVPPIHVATNPKGGWIIKDGRHRITANKLLGNKTILARFSTDKIKNR